MRLHRGFIFAIVSWLLAASPAGFASVVCLAADSTAPVPLYTPQLRTPQAVAGTELAPEVTVEVEVDARGKVAEVKVLSIQPSSDHDEAFREVAEETLARWRYAPATEDGEAVATRLSWMVQFPKIDAVDSDVSPWAPAWTGRVEERSSGDRWAELMALSVEKRTEMLQEQANIAAGCMERDKIKRVNSQRFMVFTDAPTEETANILAGNLEAAFNALTDLMGGDLPLQPEPYRVVVFMYASKNDYDRLTRRVDGLEWAAGFYTPLGMMAFHMQLPSNERLLSLMLHEATHAFVDRYLVRPGSGFPRWLGEGFAEYVGNSKISKGQLIPGKTRRNELYRTPFQVVRGKSTQRITVDELRKKAKEGTLIPLERLLSAPLEEFYGEERELYYSMGWLLVHYLRHGEESWAEERFPRLLLYAAEGYPADEVVREIYGEVGAIEARFLDYIREF